MFTTLKPPVKPYPLATKSQEVIPHELTAPAGCYKLAIPVGASYVLEDVPSVPVLAIVTSQPVLAVFTDTATAPTITNGTYMPGTMICSAGTTMIAKPETAHIALVNQGSSEATVFVQLLHTWNILGTSQQTQRI